MTASFSPAARAIFDKQVLAHVACLDLTGGPHVTPVWVGLDGEDVIINTALGRAKARFLANDSRVAVSLTDPENPYVCVALRGIVTGFTTEGADDVIDAFAQKYLGVDSYPMRREGEVRVTVRITPEHISVQPE